MPRMRLIGAIGLLAAVACAAQVTFTEYLVPTATVFPDQIAAGPDGNLWFTEPSGDKIGRITPAGVITEFLASTGSNPLGITAGPDGNMWFTEEVANKIGRITLAGVVTE